MKNSIFTPTSITPLAKPADIPIKRDVNITNITHFLRFF
jgi:hypothetical protein